MQGELNMLRVRVVEANTVGGIKDVLDEIYFKLNRWILGSL